MTMMLIAFVIVLIAVAILVGRDVSSRREIAALRADLSKATARVAEQNSLATVGEMVSNLAQQLKTPLQDVLGNAELMLATSRQSGGSDQSPGEIDEIEEIQHIRDGVERAAGIVRNLVAFTETVSLSCRWHDVNDILDRAVDACRHDLKQHGVVVDRAASARLPMVYVDGRQLEKVLTALLARPAHAVEASGVPVRPDRPFTVAVAATLTSAPDERVVLTIADDGPAGEQAAVGAALATGRRVIEAHGGTLTMASPTLSTGRTQTIIELPITAVPAAAKAQETSPKWTESSTSSTSIASGISTS
jgi:signal transduction histidine kinase